GLPQSAPAETLPYGVWTLFAADVHKHALVGLGVALLAGVPLDDGGLALVQCIGQLGILGQLGAELVLHAEEFLLLGADGYLVMDEADEEVPAYRYEYRCDQPLREQPAPLIHGTGCPLSCAFSAHTATYGSLYTIFGRLCN